MSAETRVACALTNGRDKAQAESSGGTSVNKDMNFRMRPIHIVAYRAVAGR
jgi:hypothetical protein